VTNPLLPAPARTAGRVLVWVLLALLVILVAAAAWLGVRGYLAYGHLTAAQRAAGEVTRNLDDTDAATARLADIAADTAAARALTSDPVWQAAEVLPWVGDQLSAVATVTAAVDDVAGKALTPLVRVASDFSAGALKPVDGRIDLSEFGEMHDAAQSTTAQVTLASDAVDDIDRTALLPPLAKAVEDVSGLLSSVRTGSDAVSRATALMPAILGADGPRNYLVVFQNNAEWRSLGGIVGAMALVHTENGQISLAAQASASGGIGKLRDPVLDIGPELTAFMETRPARFMQNATQVPSFPLAAQIAQAMWEREYGVRVDGVISLDPVTLSYMLAATGPVALPTGDELTSENAIPLLLNEVYLRYDGSTQDAFFQVAAASVFAKLAAGEVAPSALVSALAKAGDEERLLIWSNAPEEQAILDGTSLQGLLPVTDSERTSFGVYLNDATGSKMDYYMKVGTGVQWCTAPGGPAEAVLDVSLKNDAPADAAALPASITGGGGFGTEAGLTRTTGYLYLPEGASVLSSENSDGSGFQSGTDQGRPVLIWSSLLAPGQEASASIRVRTPWTPELSAQVTPVLPGTDSDLVPSCG
jgi:hypothetical protein